MSTALPASPAPAQSHTARISLVVSSYNEEYTGSLRDNCQQELAKILPNTLLDVAQVPGAFEVPVACEVLMNQDNPPQAIIALGLIIQGQTKHAELVADSVTTSLQSIAIKHQTPVIHEVLLVENEQQAYARCIGETLNRGKEAARATHAMLELFSKIK